MLESSVETVQKDYGTLYITHLKLDTTPERRAQIVQTYNHELVGRRSASRSSVAAWASS